MPSYHEEEKWVYIESDTGKTTRATNHKILKTNNYQIQLYTNRIFLSKNSDNTMQSTVIITLKYICDIT